MEAVQSRDESFGDIIPKRSERMRLILEVLDGKELTAEEIADKLCEGGLIRYYDRNFVAPRLTELKDAGIVKVVGRRLSRRSKKIISVWGRVDASDEEKNI